MSSPFLKLFGKSPFRPLYKHMETVYHCTKALSDFLTATNQENWSEAETAQANITSLEHKADDIKRDFRLNLPKDMFLPVARGDLLDLVSKQDRIANKAKDIAGIMLGRKMVLPKDVQPTFMAFLNRCIDATKQAFKAIRELNDLYDAGFGRKEAEIIEEMIHTLHDIEHDTDKMQIELRRAIFKQEDSLPAVHVMFIYRIIEQTGMLADYAQNIGDRLQICIAK